MRDSPSSSPIKSAADSVGVDVAEAFALLGDETRLGILLALWETYEPLSNTSLSFSELFEMVNYDDRGNFNYHLGELVGTFVRKRPEAGGYELTDPALKLIQTVIGGFDAADAAFDPVEIDQPCQLCGGGTAVGYRDRHVYWKCTECSGIVPDDEEIRGFLGAIQFEPAGITDRPANQIKAAGRVAERHREGSFFDGLCPTCSGTVEASLDHCSDHESDDICTHCRRRFSTRVEFRCQVCKDHSTTSLMNVAKLHPAVTSFFESRGVSTRYTADAIVSGSHIESMVDNFTLDQRSLEPLRIRVTAEYGDESVAITFNETADVVEIGGRPMGAGTG